MAVSVTNACPLTCAHCISRSHPNGDRPTTKQAEALRIFLTDCEFKPERISITGGEPFYEIDATSALIRAARGVGCAVTIITSAFWAKTPEAASSVLAEMPTFDSLVISRDPHHRRFVPDHFIRNAYVAAKGVGLRIKIRLVQCEPPSDEEAAIEFAVRAYADADEIERQQLLRYGRAADQDIQGASFYSRGRDHCPSSGPHINVDGTVTPCCNAVSSIVTPHPLTLGNIYSSPPADIYGLTLRNTLLATLKIEGASRIRPLVRPLLGDDVDIMSVCDLCHAICSSEEVGKVVIEFMGSSEARLNMYALGAAQLGMSKLEPLLAEAAAIIAGEIGCQN